MDSISHLLFGFSMRTLELHSEWEERYRSFVQAFSKLQEVCSRRIRMCALSQLWMYTASIAHLVVQIGGSLKLLVSSAIKQLCPPVPLVTSWSLLFMRLSGKPVRTEVLWPKSLHLFLTSWYKNTAVCSDRSSSEGVVLIRAKTRRLCETLCCHFS